MDTSPAIERKPEPEAPEATPPQVPCGFVELTEPAAPTPTPAAPPAEGYTTNGVGKDLALAFHGPAPAAPRVAGLLPAPDPRPPLAVFCYEGPETYVGGHVARLAAALGRRGYHVQLFSRTAFPKAEGVTVHAAGGGGSDLLAGVE